MMLGYFPDPYPDELLYNLCGRYSDHLQYENKYTVLELLFGHKGPVCSIDLPNRLNHFASRLPPEYGYSVDDLIDQHTLMPYYKAFLPLEKISSVRQDMKASDSGHKAISRAGLGTTRIRPPEQLRYCPVCVEEDRKQFGESYWHRVHQVPGVEVCPQHVVWLEESRVAVRRQTNQYDFISAENAGVSTDQSKDPGFSRAVREDLLSIAQEAAWLLNHPNFVHDLDNFRNRYIVALIERGLASYQSNIVRANELFRQFRQRFPRKLLQLLHCDFKEDSKNNWLYRFGSSSPVLHPLYYLLVLRFLGYTVSEFEDLPTVFDPFGKGPWPCLNPVCKDYRQPKIDHVEIIYDPSQRRLTGKFACECGFVYYRTGPDQSPEDRFRRNVRLQAYGPVWEEALACLLNQGLSAEKAAEQLGVSASTVHNQAARLGLKSSTLKSRTDPSSSVAPANINDQTEFETKREAHRAEWLMILEANKGLGRHTTIKKNNRVYSWLDRNDRDWLRKNLPSKKVRKAPDPRVDWDERDKQLAERVRESAKRLKTKAGRPERITIGAIVRDIGERDLLYSRLKKLPRTAEALKQVTESREAFAIRRIQWATDCYVKEKQHPKPWQFIARTGVSTTQDHPEVKKALNDALQQLNSL